MTFGVGTMKQARQRSAPLRLDEVERLRLARSLTVEDLAKKVGVQLRNVRRWLSGEQRVYFKNLRRLAAVLGTTTDAIRADLPEAVPPRPLKPCRFVIEIRLKGYLHSVQQKDHLVRLTPDIIQALAQEGITITGQKSGVVTSRITGPAAWRVLIAVPAREGRRRCWAMFAIKPARVRTFMDAGEFNADGATDGELITSGWGSRVPRAQIRQVARLFGCDEDTVLDLTAAQARDR
ncbi:MAG: helix-turn-helix transcriptional regulator [Phycisphaerales bacterium]|nr:helix-turn-helix transcriptional regulator [Phycisphaerales bacterium]